MQEGKKRMAARPSKEDLECFMAHSPIAHVHNVTAALCFMFGAQDRRVVMSEPKLYVARLRSRGDEAPKTRVTIFPDDTHALDRPQTTFEYWLTMAWWFKEHM